MQDVYRVADYIADFIADQGVGHVFLLPGGGAMHLVDGVGKSDRITVVPCLHEQAASIAAEAYARINENIGVAMVTSGPGATNAITAVAGAWIESVPMVIISGQVKRSDMMRGAPLRQKGVQEVDIVTIVKSITKFATAIDNPEDVRAVFEEAFHVARERRQGPVWIDVPLDIQGAPIDIEQLRGWGGVEENNTVAVATDDLAQFNTLLEQSERPVILAGHGVRLAGGAEAFRHWVESLGIPVVMTWNAMDLLSYDHPQNIGRPGVVALRAPNFAIQNSDLLISIGSRLDNVITAYNPRGFARAAKKVVVDVDLHEIEKLDMEIDLRVAADAGQFLNQLLQQSFSSNLEWKQWLEHCNGWKKRYSLANEKSFSGEKEMTHYQFVDQLSDLLPEERIIATGSSGLAVEAFYSAFRNREGQRIFLTSGLGSMGYGLPAAIGACFANGKQPMYAIESDGSLQLNIQELATIRAYNLPVCLIIMNNDGYCSIRNTQRNYFNSRFVGTGPEAGLRLPDLAEVAKTYEIPYIKISSPKTLINDLNKAVESIYPLIVDIRLVKNEALSPKVAALPQPDGSILSMPLEDMSPLLPIIKLQKEMIIELLPISYSARNRN